MTSNLQLQTLYVAVKYGGDFASRLAAAGLKADPLNRNRLFDAFPELEEKYGPTGPFWALQAAIENQQQETAHG